MLYSDLINLIRSVAHTVNPTGTFIHGKRVDGSFIDSKPFPQIHLYPVRTTKNVIDGNDTHNILMGFWYQDAAESTPEQREVIIGKADVLCNQFIAEMGNQGQYMTGVTVEPQYQTLAAIASGYALSFTLNTKSADCE